MDQSPFSNRTLLPESPQQLGLFTPESIHATEKGVFDLPQTEEKLKELEGKSSIGVDLGGDKIASQIFKAQEGRTEASGDQKRHMADNGQGYVTFLEEVADRAMKEELPVGLSVAGPLEGTKLHKGPNVSSFAEEFEAV